MTLNNSLFTSTTEEWATPQAFFDTLNAEFGFVQDVCATPENAKCQSYFTKADNGLERHWRTDGPVFMNPPYGRAIAGWVHKAASEAARGCTVVALLPARTDTRWWHDYCAMADEIRFLRGRLKFGDAKSNAPFPSVVVIWRGEATR